MPHPVECAAMIPARYDLHTHSTASDGTLAPAQLVARARQAGVEVLALTDHDTLDGIAEAQAAAAAEDIWLVSGVEISVTWNGLTVHLLGLGVEPDAPELVAGLQRLRAFRDWRAEEIGRRLAAKGIPDCFAGARALSNGHLVGRTHFARHLVRAGHARSVADVFEHFLVRGKPGYVPGDWAGLEEAVGWIRDAGGEPVIAHPARYKLTRSKLRRLIGEFREAGGVGLEVVSGSHSRDQCFTIAQHAVDFELAASAGSDYHGPENPWIELGRLPPLPDRCRPIWAGW